MLNPFDSIDTRLTNIENMLLDIKQETRQPLPQDKAGNDLLTVQTASEYLSLSPATIYSKVSRGELPYMKRSKRIYFSRAELMAYLKEGHYEAKNQRR